MDNIENMENELQHHGVKGMKWGVRRTPAQLGHRTPIRKKLASRWEEVQKKKQAKAEEKAAKRTEKLRGERSASKKAMHEMNDEELAAAINRARMEDTYRMMRPAKVGVLRRSVRSLRDDVVAPAVKEAGRQFLKDALTKVGKDLLKDQVDKTSWEYLDTINWRNLNEYKKYMGDTDSGKKNDSPDTTPNNSTENPQGNSSNNSKNRSSTEARETKRQEESGSDVLDRPKGRFESTKTDQSKNETISIDGPGVTLLDPVSTSSSKTNTNKRTTNTIVLDDDSFRDVSSPQASSAISSGKSTVSGYLSAPASSSTTSNKSTTTKGESWTYDRFANSDNAWESYVYDDYKRNS